MIGTCWAIGLVGLAGHLVEVEAHIARGLPAFTLIGLPDASLAEAKQRVRAAIASTGLQFPASRVTVGLSPAPLPKSGSMFDLAIAMAVLAGARQISADVCADVVFLGELGLDGRLRPVRGILPAVAHAAASGYRKIVVPTGNLAEAELVSGVEVKGQASLAGVLAMFGMDVDVPPVEPVPAPAVRDRAEENLDLADVIGQENARLALEIAAAGGHHLLMSGPPGAGKTMLAARLPTILPPLDDEAALEVTAIHSISGTFDPGAGLIRRPPFEEPHHTATPAAIVGGGSGLPRPGAASRAHRGVLFLDEAPEFSAKVLETLRQPLEHGELTIARAGGTAVFPARFQLVMAANPCPCGNSFGKAMTCTCSPTVMRRYFARLSGPLLDRIDIRIHVPAARLGQVTSIARGEDSATVAERVAHARQAARARLAGTGWTCNAEVPGAWLREHLRDSAALTPLTSAVQKGLLTLRGMDRVLRVAYSIADLQGHHAPTERDIGQAFAFRTQGVT